MNQVSACPVDADLVDQVCEWQARNVFGLTAAEKIEFLNWLQTSPHHVREYLRHARLMALVPQAVRDPRRAVRPNAAPVERFPRRGGLKWAAALTLACVAVYWGIRHL